jgi:hypothetical protein
MFGYERIEDASLKVTVIGDIGCVAGLETAEVSAVCRGRLGVIVGGGKDAAARRMETE